MSFTEVAVIASGLVIGFWFVSVFTKRRDEDSEGPSDTFEA